MTKYTKTELAIEIEQLKQQLRERERRSLSQLLVYLLDIFAVNRFYYLNYHNYQKVKQN